MSCPSVTFLICTLRTFGSVRELVETANRLSAWGCDVTVATPTGEPCAWLPLHCRVVPYDRARSGDALVMMTAPDAAAMDAWDRLEAGRRLLVMMGFDPSTLTLDGEPPDAGAARHLRRLLGESREGRVEVCADAAWQVEFFRRRGCRVGVALGGINTAMFTPGAGPPAGLRPVRYGVSGDPRPRKANAVAQRAIRAVGGEPEAYWGLTEQTALVRFLQGVRVFVDSHERAGWCNPVLEAMACGAAAVCSDIPASADFARHEETALRVQPGDVDGFARALRRLDDDPALLARLSAAGAAEARRWDYDREARGLYDYLTGP